MNLQANGRIPIGMNLCAVLLSYLGLCTQTLPPPIVPGQKGHLTGRVAMSVSCLYRGKPLDHSGYWGPYGFLSTKGVFDNFVVTSFTPGEKPDEGVVGIHAPDVDRSSGEPCTINVPEAEYRKGTAPGHLPER